MEIDRSACSCACMATWASLHTVSHCLSGVLRYRKGLPPAVMKMNEECLRLRPHDHPGYQTVDDIRRIVREAIGAAAADPDELVDDLIGDDEIYF